MEFRANDFRCKKFQSRWKGEERWMNQFSIKWWYMEYDGHWPCIPLLVIWGISSVCVGTYALCTLKIVKYHRLNNAHVHFSNGKNELFEVEIQTIGKWYTISNEIKVALTKQYNSFFFCFFLCVALTALFEHFHRILENRVNLYGWRRLWPSTTNKGIQQNTNIPC